MTRVRHAIVEVRYGPSAFRRAVIEPGRTLSIGRTDISDFVVPHDEQMSGTHLELKWDGATCTLRSLNASLETFVNGEAVKKIEVSHGAWIRAGITDFSFYVEGNTPPPRGSTDRSPEAQATAQKVLETLWTEARRNLLFAILDTAQGERTLEILRESIDDYQPLYEGIKAVMMESAAPYLVQFSDRSSLLDRLVQEGWGKHWGIYLTSRQRFADVRRHLRKFLVVEAEETREQMYFRFYDPRVLRTFLPLCTTRQTIDFFGDIEAFLVEGRVRNLLRFERTEERRG